MKRSTGCHPLSAATPTVEHDADGLRSERQDWAEEAGRTAEAAAAATAEPLKLFAEFRRKLALGEALARAFEKLAEALHFSGRITLTFHQGRLTKTVLEEAYFRGRPMT
jgi:hypothetical protein